MMWRTILIVAVLSLWGSGLLAQAPDYLPIDSDIWYTDISNSSSQLHRYGGENIQGYQSYHMEIHANGQLLQHTIWLQTRDDDGSIFNHGGSFDGGVSYWYLEPPMPLVQSPLVVGDLWEYQCQNLPLSTVSWVQSEEDLYICSELMHAFELIREETYDGTTNTYIDFYVDGFGTAMMEWAGTTWMGDCVTPTESETWDSLKAWYR